MKSLLDHVRGYHSLKRQYSGAFAKLATDQSPLALFITCCDSRIVPNILASAEPGELFIVRNIGNLVPEYGDEAEASVPAAVTYAVDVLGVQEIVVCGHSQCGAMKALLGETPTDRLLARWLQQNRGVVDLWREEPPMDPSRVDFDQLSQRSALAQVKHLAGYPVVKSALERGALRLHAWWFDIGEAQLYAYDAQSQRYDLAIEQLAKSELAIDQLAKSA